MAVAVAVNTVVVTAFATAFVVAVVVTRPAASFPPPPSPMQMAFSFQMFLAMALTKPRHNIFKEERRRGKEEGSHLASSVSGEVGENRRAGKNAENLLKIPCTYFGNTLETIDQQHNP